MTTEEEILESLAICENLPNYEDFDGVVSEIQAFSDKLFPEKEKKQEEVLVENEVITEEPSVPVAVSSANVKYDEVTRPIPTIKGVPVVAPPVEQSESVVEKVQIVSAAQPLTAEKIEEKPVKEPVKQDVAQEEAILYEVAQEESTKEETTQKENSRTEIEQDVAEMEDEDKKTTIIRGVISLVVCVFVAFLLAFLITKFVAHHTKVEGTSMETSLHDGDSIIVEKLSYYFSDPERYDVIVFPFSDGVYYIKRVIGLPGETIQIQNGKIYVDGVQLWEQYGNEEIKDPGLAREEIVLADGEYFVLGDNRNSSIDSRKAEVGVVKKDDIIGKAWFRIYPFSDFGVLKHQK